MKLAENFAGYLKNTKKSSDNTVASYMRDIKKFHTYISEENATFVSVNSQIVNSYISHMQTSGQAVSSVLRSIASLRAFYRYLVSRGEISDSPVKDVKPPKLPERNISCY